MSQSLHENMEGSRRLILLCDLLVATANCIPFSYLSVKDFGTEVILSVIVNAISRSNEIMID